MLLLLPCVWLVRLHDVPSTVQRVYKSREVLAEPNIACFDAFRRFLCCLYMWCYVLYHPVLYSLIHVVGQFHFVRLSLLMFICILCCHSSFGLSVLPFSFPFHVYACFGWVQTGMHCVLLIIRGILALIPIFRLATLFLNMETILNLDAS